MRGAAVGAVGAPAATGLLARRKPREMPYEPAGQFTPKLSLRFDSRATHARTLLPAALASVPFNCVLVRVRVGRVSVLFVQASNLKQEVDSSWTNKIGTSGNGRQQ